MTCDARRSRAVAASQPHYHKVKTNSVHSVAKLECAANWLDERFFKKYIYLVVFSTFIVSLPEHNDILSSLFWGNS